MIFKKMFDVENDLVDADTIEILHFNYDGKGGAVVKADGLIRYFNLEQVEFLFDYGLRNYYSTLEGKRAVQKANADLQARRHEWSQEQQQFDQWKASQKPKRKKAA